MTDFLSAIESLPAGGDGASFDGFRASLNEALVAMPFLKEYGTLMVVSTPSATPEQLERQRAVALAMIAIYRLAEDMGYEW